MNFITNAFSGRLVIAAAALAGVLSAIPASAHEWRDGNDRPRHEWRHDRGYGYGPGEDGGYRWSHDDGYGWGHDRWYDRGHDRGLHRGWYMGRHRGWYRHHEDRDRW